MDKSILENQEFSFFGEKGMDLFSVEDNYNFSVSAASGAGKSYFISALVSYYLAQDSNVFIFDVGQSYKALAKLTGGNYIEFHPDSNISLNFFSNIEYNKKTNEIEEKELNSILNIIEIMLHTNKLDNELKSLIKSAIKNAFAKGQTDIGMIEVYNELELLNNKNEALTDVLSALSIYSTTEGTYQKYFNGESNLDMTNGFTVFELEDIDGLHSLKSVVISTLLYNVNKKFSQEKDKNNITFIDEAWSILDNEILIENINKTVVDFPSYNASFGLITQGVSDFQRNDASKDFFQDASWKVLFKLPESDLRNIKDINHGLTKEIIDLLHTLEPLIPQQSEVVMDKKGEVSKQIFKLTPAQHFLFTNSPSDLAKIRKLALELDIPEEEARLEIGKDEK